MHRSEWGHTGNHLIGQLSRKIGTKVEIIVALAVQVVVEGGHECRWCGIAEDATGQDDGEQVAMAQNSWEVMQRGRVDEASIFPGVVEVGRDVWCHQAQSDQFLEGGGTRHRHVITAPFIHINSLNTAEMHRL